MVSIWWKFFTDINSYKSLYGDLSYTLFLLTLLTVEWTDESQYEIPFPSLLLSSSR